ncbi:MAG: amidohydrolase family protein [Candidatus Njordarchaeia archaeon]
MEIIDFHVHPIKNIITPKFLVKNMEKLGIKKSVLLAIDIGPSFMLNGVLEKKIYEAFRLTNIPNIPRLIAEAKSFLEFADTPNEHVYTFVKKYPDKFIGFGSVSPIRKEEEIRRFFDKFDEYGFKGLKTIPTLQQYDPLNNENIDLIWKMSQDRGYVILAHTGFDPGPWEYFPLSIVARPSRYSKLIEKYDVPIVLAHAGGYSAYYPGIWHRESVELANKYEHVYMDLSAVFYLAQDEKTVKLWREYNVIDKIIYGSDYPAVEGMRLDQSLNIVLNSPYLEKDEMERILFKNAAKLLKI